MNRETTIEYMRKAVACHNEDHTACLGRNCCDCPHDYPVETIDLIESALELLDEGKKDAEQDRWIPVTERLPEKDCSCRVTEGDFKSVIDCCWSNRKKQFEVWSYYHDDYVPITNVTAWKLKEDPYTEDEA